MNKLLLFVSLMLLIPLCVSAQEVSGSDRVVVWEEDFSGFSQIEKPSTGLDGITYKGAHISLTNYSKAHSPEIQITSGNYFLVEIPLNGISGLLFLRFNTSDRSHTKVKWHNNLHEEISCTDGVYKIDVPSGEYSELKLYIGNTGGRYIYLDDFVLTAPAECWKGCKSPELSYPVDTCSVFYGDSYSFPKLNNPHGLSVKYGSSDQSVATIASNGRITVKGIGSTTITAICHPVKQNNNGILVPNEYAYQRVSYVLNVKRKPLANEVFYESFNSNILEGNIERYGLIKNEASDDKAAVYDNQPAEESNIYGAERCIYFDETPNGIYKIGPFKNLSGKNCHLSLRVGGNSETSSAMVTVQGTNTTKKNLTVKNRVWTTNTLDLGDIGNDASITISGSDFFLDDVSLVADGSGVGVEIGEHKYATLYYSDTPLMVPESMTAFTLKFSGNNLVASRIYSTNDIIPKGEAVVLYATPGQYTFPVCSSSLGRDADNLLKGSDDDGLTTGGDIYYFFGVNKSGDVGFYLGKADGSAFTNKAHKAYLPLTKSESGAGTATSKAFLLSGLPFTTAIGKIHYDGGSLTEGPAYNLAGQRVGKDYKGIVIINGRKVLRK
jgi:hypothetical protein